MPSNSAALLSECRSIARTRLATVIAAALQKIDEDLFQLADKCSQRQEQQIYLDAMERVREHRGVIGRSFDQCFGDLFDQRLRGKPETPAANANNWGAVELSLVSNSRIEGGIAIDRLAKGITSAAADDELQAIRARLGHLMSRDSLDDAGNPLSPELIFEALKLACNQIPTGAAVRQAVLQAFAPYLRESIVTMYQAVNQNLIAHHVLPQIRHHVRTTADALGRTDRQSALKESVAPSAAEPLGRSGANQAGPGGETGGGRGGGFGGTTAGVAAHGGAGSPSAYGGDAAGGAGASGASGTSGGVGKPGGTGPFANTPQSLGRLLAGLAQGHAAARSEALGLFADPQRFPAGPGAVAASVAMLDSLAHLQQTLNQDQGALAASGVLHLLDRSLVAQGTPLDQLTLELVTVVFDFLFANQRLPEPVKGVMSRLQIVAIKAALIDRSFFARREHPMRRLLDRMADAGTDPLADCSEDSAFMQGLRALTDRLGANFKDDTAVFDAALAELAKLVEAQHEARLVSAQAETATLAAREADAVALAAALTDITLRLRPSTPGFISQFLSRWWAPAVAIADRAGGGDDNDSGARLRLASDLVWSVEPKSRSDVVALASSLPPLVRGLMRGTLDARMPEDERNAFFSALMATHTDAIAAAKRAAPDLKTASRPRVEDAVRRAPEPVSTPADSYAQQVAMLVKGDMVELSDERAGERFRLGWISPKKTCYVFMGQGRLRQIGSDQLAALFRQGAAALAQAETPIVDQAIEAISLDFCNLPAAA